MDKTDLIRYISTLQQRRELNSAYRDNIRLALSKTDIYIALVEQLDDIIAELEGIVKSQEELVQFQEDTWEDMADATMRFNDNDGDGLEPLYSPSDE